MDDYVNAGDPANESLDFGEGSFTATLWINILAGGYSPAIIQKSTGMLQSDNDLGFSLGYSGSGGTSAYIRARVGDGTSGAYTNGGPNLIDGKWHHLVYSWDGSTLKLYVDGVFKASNTNNAVGSISNTSSFLIGKDAINAYFAKGSIDEVHVYGQALSSAEIQQRYVKGLKTRENLAVK